MWTELDTPTYQVSSTIKWTCLSSAQGRDSVVGLEAFGYLSNTNFVRFGFMSGTGVNGNSFSRDWYSARRVGSVVEHFLRPDLPKPSRNVGYRITVRFDGATWKYFYGNTLAGQFSAPASGVIDVSFTGGGVGHPTIANTGSSTDISHQRWGETTYRSGWPDWVIADAPFTSPSGSVSTTATSESHSITNPTTGCP